MANFILNTQVKAMTSIWTAKQKARELAGRTKEALANREGQGTLDVAITVLISIVLGALIAAAITSRKAKNSLPTHVLLENVPGLAPTSLLLLEQLRTIDRKRLRGYIGCINKEKMLEVDAALAISVGIGCTTERRTHNV